MPGSNRCPHAVAATDETKLPGAAAADMPENTLRLGYHLEPVVIGARGLRRSQQQDAALSQGKMKQRQDLRLRFRAKIDQ